MATVSRSDFSAGPQAPTSALRRIPIVAFGMSLAIFLMVTYTLCVLLAFIIPDRGLHNVWLQFLPGFKWESWTGYVIGLAETFVYGWYVAIVFAPLYNYFAGRVER